MQHRAVFLDRDGVLNHAIVKNGKPYPPDSIEELTIPSDACHALQTLKSTGFLLIGVTNQPDVARGKTKQMTVEAINAKLMGLMPLDDILTCYHDDQDQCLCRKPLPGLLLQAAELHKINLKKSFMIGDRWKDIEAGEHAGCKTIWIHADYQEKKPSTTNFTATSLSEAAEWIINITTHQE